MSKCFISGSRSIAILPMSAERHLDYYIKNNVDVIIGDAEGVDTLVQQYLADHSYRNVTVYCAGGTPRNNVGNWPIRVIQADGLSGREKFTKKDIAMTEDADFGLMLYDGKSRGTKANMERMKNYGKPFMAISEIFRESTDISDYI